MRSQGNENTLYGNTTSSGALDIDNFLQATLAYRNSKIYPETGKSISQTGKSISQSLFGRIAGGPTSYLQVLPAEVGIHEGEERAGRGVRKGRTERRGKERAERKEFGGLDD